MNESPNPIRTFEVFECPLHHEAPLYQEKTTKRNSRRRELEPVRPRRSKVNAALCPSPPGFGIRRRRSARRLSPRFDKRRCSGSQYIPFDGDRTAARGALVRRVARIAIQACEQQQPLEDLSFGIHSPPKNTYSFVQRLA